MCEHNNVIELGDHAFVGPVNREPFTAENRAAHGGITRKQRCADCGATRRVNINGQHKEYSPWSAKRPELADTL
jgi:hypothetical protein